MPLGRLPMLMPMVMLDFRHSTSLYLCRRHIKGDYANGLRGRPFFRVKIEKTNGKLILRPPWIMGSVACIHAWWVR